MRGIEKVAQLWSTMGFPRSEVSAFAEHLVVEETRRGLMALSAVFLVLLLSSAALQGPLGLERSHTTTALALAVLCVHTFVSARSLRALRELHTLGMTLLIISGMAFVLLAHRSGSFGLPLFSSVALVFMVVPLVPWGLREASIVTLLIYGVVSISTWSVARRFEPQTLWTLQALMLGAGVVSLTLVGRNTSVRKGNIVARFELARAHTEVERLSLEDALTGAWNRRFLKAEFPGFLERSRKASEPCHFAILDVDHFKQLNDRHGHALGDQVLQWIGRAFRTHVGDAGHLVRTGGDEFVLLLAVEDPEGLMEEALSSICALATAESSLDAAQIALSVGLVELPRTGPVALDEAYMAADGALYRAKRARAAAASLRVARAELRRRPRSDPEGEDGA